MDTLPLSLSFWVTFSYVEHTFSSTVSRHEKKNIQTRAEHLTHSSIQQERKTKDAVALPTVGNALTVSDDVHQPSALYHLYAIRREENSWGSRNFPHVMNTNRCRSSRGSRVCTHLSSISVRGVLIRVYRLDAPSSRYTTFNPLWRALAIHIKQGLNSSAEILARHLRRYKVSGFLCGQSPRSPPHWLGISPSPPVLIDRHALIPPSLQIKTDVKMTFTNTRTPPRESIPPPVEPTNWVLHNIRKFLSSRVFFCLPPLDT